MPATFIHTDIRNSLIRELNEAKFLVWSSLAWFNDEEIYKVLVKKAEQGLSIILIVRNDTNSDDPRNFYHPNSLDFYQLVNAGGHVYLKEDNHNKYCIVDLKKFISGSYNWTYGAHHREDGLESLEIYTGDEDAIHKKAEQFKTLQTRSLTLQEVWKEPNLISEYSILNKIESAKRIDANLIKLFFSDRSFAYCSFELIKQQDVLEQKGDGIFIKDGYRIVSRAGINWLEPKDASNQQQLNSISQLDDVADDLPF